MADRIKTIRRQLTDNIRERDLEVQLFLQRLRVVFDQEISRLERRIKSDSISAQQATLLTQRVLDSLRDGPIAEEIRQIEKTYANELIRANKTLEASGITAKQINFTAADLDTVEALIFTQEQDIKAKLSQHVNKIRTEVIRTTLMGTEPDLEDLREDVTPKVFNQLETEINTQASAVHQAATISKADRYGLELYIYMGPEDSRTRPFCNGLLSKEPPIYSKAEIQAKNNGQGLNVLTYGGGYNCRHVWNPITAGFAKELGYDD